MSPPCVAIVGRANVGKSTLFNRITKTRSAIVNNTPGVTRDRMYKIVEWFNKTFQLIDTGGIDLAGENEIELQVIEQAEIAIAEADCILMVVDGQHGLTPQDLDVIEKIRKSGKLMVLVVNKIDDPKHEALMGPFYELGVNNTYPISAEHGVGISYLLEELVKNLPESKELKSDAGIQVGIIGRPNAGKSSLINRLVNTDRCIISDIPGTTRDSVDTLITFEGQNYILVDTAGIRRKGKTTHLLDKVSVVMALKALERCEVAVLVIDAEVGVSDQDATIAGYALERGCGCILAINKWDALDRKEATIKVFDDKVRNKLKFLDFAPIMHISAKTGYGLKGFFPLIFKVFGEYNKTIPTGKLNDCFSKAIQKNPMSSYRGKFLKLFYSTQTRTCPPTFQCFVNYPEGIHFSYKRYLINSLRKGFGFSGTPIRLNFSPRKAKT